MNRVSGTVRKLPRIDINTCQLTKIAIIVTFSQFGSRFTYPECFEVTALVCLA
jgi:hypothetical protein